MCTEKNIKHVAIIPDGNRRWAKIQKLPSIKGHEAGFERLRNILQCCKDSGPNILSFYAFSTENFKRSETEITNLFSLLDKILDSFTKELIKNNIQLRISGSSDRISKDLYKKLEKSIAKCSKGEFILNICFNYGSQEELINVVKKAIKLHEKKNLSIENINKPFFESLLWNGDLPAVDLLIRTSGEYRMSNFMLWQCAYAELYFSSKLWPDFQAEDFLRALAEYKKRHRKFGK